MSKTVSELLREAYEPYYNGRHDSDSPDKGRLTMASRIASFTIAHADERPVILDIGAGRQSVERMVRMFGNSASGQGKYADLPAALEESRFLTVDLAAVPNKRRRINWAHHLVADMVHLPVRRDSIDLVVSNFALDMLRWDREGFSDVLQGVSDVMRPGGSAFFHFHHSTLFPSLCDFYRDRSGPQTEFYDGNLRNPYYTDSASIERDLSGVGIASTVNIQSDHTDVWWEVEAVKEMR